MISSLTPEIIYEDKDIIICHKPAGVPTQSSRIGTKDMVSILKNHLIKNTAKKTASREPYLAVIHRLDQPVEGLLVLQQLLPQRNFPASLPHLVLGNITVHRL